MSSSSRPGNAASISLKVMARDRQALVDPGNVVETAGRVASLEPVHARAWQAKRREQPIELGDAASAHESERAAQGPGDAGQDLPECRIDADLPGRVGEVHERPVDVEEQPPPVRRIKIGRQDSRRFPRTDRPAGPKARLPAVS